MVEQPDRRRVGEYPRATEGTAWEVFVRGRASDPLRHVGSVTAPSAAVAHEEATALFAWYATDVWVCPADAVSRYSTHALDGQAEPASPTPSRTRQSDDLDQ